MKNKSVIVEHEEPIGKCAENTDYNYEMVDEEKCVMEMNDVSKSPKKVKKVKEKKDSGKSKFALMRKYQERIEELADKSDTSSENSDIENISEPVPERGAKRHASLPPLAKKARTECVLGRCSI